LSSKRSAWRSFASWLDSGSSSFQREGRVAEHVQTLSTSFSLIQGTPMSADATPMAADAPREPKQHRGFVPWFERAANHSLFAFIGGNRGGIIGGNRRSLK